MVDLCATRRAQAQAWHRLREDTPLGVRPDQPAEPGPTKEDCAITGTTQRCSLPAHGIWLAADRWEPASNGIAHDPADTALLLHGGGQTRHSWRDAAQRLTADGWTCLTLDLRGHGESDWARDGDYQLDTFAADLRSVIDALRVRPVLVGASLGGMASLLALGADPSLARALILVDVAPRVEAEGTAEVARFMRDGLAGYESLQDAARAVAEYNPLRLRAPRPDGLRKNMRYRDGRWYWHWDPRMLDSDDRLSADAAAVERRVRRAQDAAKRVSVPTLLIRGQQSNVVSSAGVRDLLEHIPHAQYLDVAGAGHMVAGDDNDAFTAGLQEFLTSLRSSDADHIT